MVEFYSYCSLRAKLSLIRNIRVLENSIFYAPFVTSIGIVFCFSRFLLLLVSFLYRLYFINALFKFKNLELWLVTLKIVVSF